MATTRKTTRTRRRPAVTAPRMTAQDRFTGLTGVWKAVAQFGLSGVVAATMMYAVLVAMPAQQQLHLEQTEKSRAAGYEHGEKAVEKIAGSIDALRSSWSNVQGVTQGNQKELIRQQERTNELLEQRTTIRVTPQQPAQRSHE